VSSSRSRFDGKVVFITGGASGIGEATAIAFADEGAKVVIADIQGDLAIALSKKLPDSMPIKLDVTDSDAVDKAFDNALAAYGAVNVVFNNAGINDKRQPLHETDLDNWRRVTGVDGDGFFYVLRAGIRALLQSGGGAIVNTASTAGLAGVPYITPYTYAKAGVVALTRTAAYEYAGENIRVNAVAPGTTFTPLMKSHAGSSGNGEEYLKIAENSNPIPGWIMPEDIANAVLFLASDEARRITGHTLPVEGGQLTLGVHKRGA